MASPFALLLVMWLVLMAGPAHAEPITIAIFGSAFAATTAGSIVTAVFGIAFSYGASLLQRMLAGKPEQQAVGVRAEVEMGDDLPVSTVIGRYATTGKRRYINVYGEIEVPNEMLVDVITLSDIPLSGTIADLGLWIDDKKCTIDTSPGALTGKGYPVVELRDNLKNGGYDDLCWVKFYNGNQTTADSYLVNRFKDDEKRPYSAKRIGKGIAYVIMTYRFNTDFYSGVPRAVFEAPSVPLYDISKDSTAGGNGSHRWNNKSTWEPSVNNAVIIYNIIRGMYYGNEWFFGGQNLAARRLPASSWIAAIQECNRDIDTKANVTEPQFRGGYEIKGDEEPLDVIEYFRAGCAGRLAEVGGSFKLQVGGLPAAAYSFTDANIIITEGQTFEPFPGLAQTFNSITASYPEPEQKWASKDAPPLLSSDLEAKDGDRRLPTGVTFPATPYKRQVQRLMRLMRKDQRRFRQHQFFLPPDAWRLEPNDIVTWTSERNGYINKRFIVVAIEGRATMNQLVSLREVDPSDYDWSSDFEVPTRDGYVGPVDVPIQYMTGFYAQASTVNNGSGNIRPAIIVGCQTNMVDVRRVRIRVRLVETGEIVYDTEGLPYNDEAKWKLSGNWCLPNTNYEIQGRLIPITKRKTDFGPWVAVRTGDHRFSTEDVLDNAITQAKIVDAAITANKIMDGAVDALKLADKAVTENKIAIGAVTKDLLASGAIVAEKFAGGIGPVGIITGSTVPTTKTLEVITVAGKLYRWDPAQNKYTAAVPAADVAGQISGSQIADDAIDATKFANDLAPVKIVTGSTLPTTKVTDVIFFQGKLYRWISNAYTAAVPTQDLTGTVNADQIAANAITAGKIAADAITSANIQAGAIKAEQIAAGAITTGKLTVMDTSNLVAGELLDPTAWNGGMETGWNLQTSTATSDELGRVMIYAGPAQTGLAPNAAISLQYSNFFPVNVGEPLAVNAKMRSFTVAKGVFRVEVNFKDKDNNDLANTLIGAETNLGGTLTTQVYSAVINPPANAVTARLRFRVRADSSGNFTPSLLIRSISVRRAASAELIVDGAITTDKLTANAVSADKIAANAITSDKVAANAITAGKIAAGSIDTDKLAAGAVVADKIDANAVTAQKIAAGSVTAVKIGAGAITTDKLDAEAVTAAKIAAETIGADKIAANSITAKHLVLTDFTNMIPDNALQDPKAWTFTASSGVTLPSIGVYGQYGNALRFTDNGVGSGSGTFISGAVSQPFNVKPGEQYRFGATIDFNTDSDNQGVRIYIRYYDANGDNFESHQYAEPKANNLSVRNVAENSTVPSAAVKADIYIRKQVPTNGGTSNGTLYVWNVFCYRRANAELIVDGAITADKINVNSLTAINIKVTNADINDLTVNGEKLVPSAISNTYFNTSGSSVPSGAVTNILSRSLVIQPDEKLLVTGFWNLRGLPSLNSEIMWLGNCDLRVGSTILDSIKMIGPAINNYCCCNQSISGIYQNNGNSAITVNIIMRFNMGTGGVVRDNDMNQNRSPANWTNDGTSFTITRLKK